MIALHGFLGKPTDWSAIVPPDCICPNWLSLTQNRPDLLEQLAHQLIEECIEGETIIGYSMGGRLALLMLTAYPQHFRQAVIISASPGLSAQEDPEARRNSDRQWAKRFLSEDWDTVVADWNRQAVFATDPPTTRPRIESDFNRNQLAWALEFGSVANQPDLRPALSQLAIPILWIAGERDVKYSKLAHECAALSPQFEVSILPDCGHRAPWTNSTAFQNALKSFIHREN